MEIDKSLYIPRDIGCKVVVTYSDPIPVCIKTEDEVVLKMVHAYHGVIQTSFVGDGSRSIVYWFRSEKNANRFVKDFSIKGKSPIGWRAERFENDIYNGKEFDINGYGLLSENSLL